MIFSTDKFAALEIDLHDESVLRTFRIWSGRANQKGLTRKVDGETVKFMLGLQIPFTVEISISAEQYGVVLRGNSNGGNIQFLVNEESFNWINNFHWRGGNFRAYEGKGDDEFENMELVYVGKVANLNYNVITNMATIGTLDRSLDLNKPLITDLYRNVSGILDIENLNGVLDKEISGNTILTIVECTSPGIIFTGVIDFQKSITFVKGFVGLVQVSNQTSGGFDLVFGLASGGGTVNVGNGSGEVLYSDGNGFIISTGSAEEEVRQSLIGLPKPKLWGEVKSLEPILETNDLVSVYRISTEAFYQVIKFSVGGISDWDKVSGSPGSGEWSENTSTGTIELGSAVLGSEIRCDVRAVGYDSLTTGQLVKEIIEEKDLEFDIESFNTFITDAPQLIGYFKSTTAINTLDAIDEITFNISGWWVLGFEGKLLGGVIAKPGDTVDFTLYERDIETFLLNDIIPPAWRIRVEFAPNNKPLGNALIGVTEAEKLILTASGLNTEPYSNVEILTLEPLAIDVAVVKSFVLNLNDAEMVRDRVSEAWGVERRVYDLTYFGDDIPGIYDTIGIDFQGIVGNFRVHGITRSIGGGEHGLKIWG